MSIKDVSLFYGPDYDSSITFSGDGKGPIYANWDADMISICRCDYAFFGSDCSLSRCFN
jgi:hypothetical protein